MTKKKPPSIPIDAAMQEYAASSNLALPELVSRMWQLWHQVEQLHGTLYPSQLAGEKLDSSLDTFLEQMQREADELDEEYEGDASHE